MRSYLVQHPTCHARLVDMHTYRPRDRHDFTGLSCPVDIVQVCCVHVDRAVTRYVRVFSAADVMEATAEIQPVFEETPLSGVLRTVVGMLASRSSEVGKEVRGRGEAERPEDRPAGS